MLKISFLFMAMVFLAFSCQHKSTPTQRYLWKNLPSYVNTEEEVQQELAQKMKRVQQFLKENHLGGVILSQVRNVYWITAGKTNTQIVLNKDVGTAWLFIRDDGAKFVICNGSEAGRLMDESLKSLGYKLILYNWYEANPLKDVRRKILADLAKGRPIGSDVPIPGTRLVDKEFARLRYQLTEPEMKRYRWLGRQVAEAVETVCRHLRPGMNEFQIEAMTAEELRSRGIFPTVLLIGVDQRIYKYRHALPAGAVLKKYGMVNVVAEKWGMPIAVTRFVHFGPLPKDLEERLKKTAIVMAHYQAATVPGKSCAEIFEECKKWYADVGFPGEWKKHHQGGAIGYNDREYVIYPGIQETVLENQAFAWNPTITGAKVEDTFIVHRDSIEVITRTGNWPELRVHLNNKVYPQPAILVVDPQTGEVMNAEAVDIQ